MSKVDAYKAAQSLLCRREHSFLELKNKLKNKGFEESDIENSLFDLKDKGLQSDERFAEAFVRFKKNSGKGPTVIENELREKGLDDNLIAKYLNLSDFNEDWDEKIKEVCRKKFSSQPKDLKEWQKQARFLYQRGFTTLQIKRVLSDENIRD